MANLKKLEQILPKQNLLYIADTNGYHIRSYNVATTYVGTFAGNGMADVCQVHAQLV